jgi:predicted RNA polymerase sigma factor
MIRDAVPGFRDLDKAGLATPDEEAAIDVFNDRLVAEGHWVFAGGLAAPSQKSRAAYDKAIELAGNTAETACLTRRRDQLG